MTVRAQIVAHEIPTELGTIVISENLIAMWHFELNGGNFLGALEKTPSAGLNFIFRFRTYYDDKIWPNTQDVRRWFTADMSQFTQAEALERVREFNAEVSKSCTSAITEIAMDETGLDGFWDKLRQLLPTRDVAEDRRTIAVLEETRTAVLNVQAVFGNHVERVSDAPGNCIHEVAYGETA